MQHEYWIAAELWRSVLINNSLMLSWEDIQGTFIFIWAQHMIIWSLHRISLMLHLLPACVQLLPTRFKLTSYASGLKEKWKKNPAANFSLLDIMHFTIIHKFHGMKKPQELCCPPSWEREEVYLIFIKKAMRMLAVRESKSTSNILHFNAHELGPWGARE